MTNEHNCGERTNSDGYYVVKHRIPYDDSSQLERSYRTALPLHTGMYDVSLLKLTPQIYFKNLLPRPTDSILLTRRDKWINPNRKVNLNLLYYNIHIKSHISQALFSFIYPFFSPLMVFSVSITVSELNQTSFILISYPFPLCHTTIYEGKAI